MAVCHLTVPGYMRRAEKAEGGVMEPVQSNPFSERTKGILNFPLEKMIFKDTANY